LIDVSLTISPIRNSAGVVVGASHVARDITERKHFEEKMRQTQRLESLGVLAGGIAHDFNNLLTGIIGNASLLADYQPAEGPARSYVADLLVAAERAADLTRQLLAYSGRGQFIVSPLNISDAVAEITTLVKASIPKTATVRLDLERDVPPVEADVSQIQQLVMNLIINGAEAIGEHRAGTVLVRTGSQELDESYLRAAFPSQELPPGDYAYIEVHDDGQGMDEKTRSRIFEPFFTTKFTGRGLGLAAALGIVQAHHGAIRVHSTPEQGSTFTIFLPAIKTGESRRSQKPSSKGTVLVVDDEEIVRRVAKSALESYGYDVLLASNGKEAVDVFRK
jgi:signal transduction histidine kinase